MSGLRFSFSRSLVTMGLVFINASCLSSVAFAMEPDEDKTLVVSAAPSFKGSTDGDSLLQNFVVSNPTIISSVFAFMDPGSLMYMGETNRYFHQICNSSAIWDILFKRDLYPSISLTSLHIKSPSRYYGLAFLVQEKLLPSSINSEIDHMPREWWEGMISQTFPENSPQGNYLLGLLYELCGNLRERVFNIYPNPSLLARVYGRVAYDPCDDLSERAFKAYKKAADEGCEEAQSKVVEALCNGTLNQRKRSEQERYEELKTRDANGDQKAQKKVNEFLREGTFGQRERSKQERYEELKMRGANGDIDARWSADRASYEGKLGQGKRPEEEQYEELRRRGDNGDKNARKYANRALCEGELGQDKRPEEERYEELRRRGDNGDKDAQWGANRASYDGKLGQGKRPKGERYEELKARAANGDKNAQEYVDTDLYNRNLVAPEELSNALN